MYVITKKFIASVKVPVSTICDRIGRSRNSVVLRLRSLGLLDESPCGTRYTGDRTRRPSIIPIEGTVINETETQTEKETIMDKTTHAAYATRADFALSNIAVDHKTYIFGQEASTVSDEEIFAHIARIEQQIDSLKAIRAQSKKRAANIAKLEADVQALVAIVDAR